MLSIIVSCLLTFTLAAFSPDAKLRPQNRSRRLSDEDGDVNNDVVSRINQDPHSWGNHNTYNQGAAATIGTYTNLIPRFGVTPRNNVNYHSNQEMLNYQLESTPNLRPEVDRFYDHTGGNMQGIASYDVDSGHLDASNDQHNGHPGSDYYPTRPQLQQSLRVAPLPPIYVAVKTTDEHDPLSKLGFLTILKLVLAKFKTFWLVKFGLLALFLIKIPFFLLKIALKLLIVLKFTKLLKLIIIPSLVPLVLLPLLPLLMIFLPLLLLPLAPLLLIPILLPLLLPLLLLLPVPIFAHHHPHYRPNPSGPPPSPESLDPDEERAQRSSIRSMEDLIVLTRRVMESERCMEKLGCEIAGNQTPGMLAGTVSRLLEVFQTFAPRTILGRVRSYTKAFKLGAEEGRKCASEFLCSFPHGLTTNLNSKV